LAALVLAGYGGYRLLPRLSALLAPRCTTTPAGAAAGPGASLGPAGVISPDSSAGRSPAGAASGAPGSADPGPGPSLAPIATLPPDPPAGAAALRVPVLIYHKVVPNADPAASDYQMTPALMESQLCLLAARGWRTITARELGERLASSLPPPQRTVVITLDDGTGDHLANAYPILRRYGFSATFFVIAGFVGTDGYLTWDQVRTLRDGGMEIGSHSTHHPRMSEISAAGAATEVRTAQEMIGRQLGAQPVTFAYPGGAYNDTAVAAVRDAGLLAAFTTAVGRSATWADRLTIPRVINVGAVLTADKLLSWLEDYVK
jgi:peptidoglycan/xylan/chitin deacetylase (PgdA/CDA1 family)